MTRRCLVSVYGPGNVIAALSAVKWYGLQRYADERADVVTIVHHPGLPDDMAKEAGIVVERMISSQGWSKPTILLAEDIEEITHAGRLASYREILQRFRHRIGADNFDEVFYAHDVVGPVAELAMNAYPKAEHITFGDALGSVYDKQYHLDLASGTSFVTRQDCRLSRKYIHPIYIIYMIKEQLRLIVLGGPKKVQATKAVLILPMDQTGNCLDDKELLVIPKKIVLDIISGCNSAILELSQYSETLMEDATDPSFLLLLENISDGGFISFEREVAMYEDIIRSNIPPGRTIFIKAHPFSVANIDEAVYRRLNSDYNARIVSSEFRRYPIELWKVLASKCQVISISYPSISLTFLYDRPVIYPMGASMIQTFIPERYWDSYMNADMLYKGQLANLSNWDGQGVLWRGSIS